MFIYAVKGKKINYVHADSEIIHDKYFETKGYRIHAAQMLKTLSSKVKKARVPASA